MLQQRSNVQDFSLSMGQPPKPPDPTFPIMQFQWHVCIIRLLQVIFSDLMWLLQSFISRVVLPVMDKIILDGVFN